MAELTASMPRLIGQITLRFRFVRITRLRLWLASRAVGLVGLIAGCHTIVEADEKAEPIGAAIPMRLSVDDHDFYRSVGTRLVVYLDGAAQDGVTAYDIEAGTVERYVRDAEGRPVGWHNELLRETVQGVVTVGFRGEDAAPHERVGAGQRPG
ncbi:hypothetical protein HHL26_06650 [Sphingobium sp. TB-6]|uniref:hypothetical protein n=1 Tax=Sphingobium sp. TB-6 TaxID=2728850 RepID=UPI00146A8CA1|nr:hypothetical protein [Sphingobium sp. TB-6]NML88746.1 hypothetical protein [Sphingobium sp. TB-6]